MMKAGNLIVAIALVALCLIGWLSLGTKVISQSNAYDNYVEQGDAWVKDGLYQRAIGQYEEALKEKKTEEVVAKELKAYELRYQEAPEETIEDFKEFLESALKTFPANKDCVNKYVALCMTTEKYEDAYTYLVNAIENGYDSAEAKDLLRQVKYAYEIGRTIYYMVRQSDGNMYAVYNKNGHNAYSKETGTILVNNCEAVGIPSAEGVVVATAEDSRLMNAEGLVMGIFETKVTDAGVYADGLVPACCNGVYAYYDEFAKKQFGQYQFAGMFQDGVAAVNENGKWKLVDTKGKVVKDDLGELIVDYAGRHIINERIIAKTSANELTIYDKKYKSVAKVSCTDADILTEDGVIAICQNGKWGFVNTEGKMVIECQYQEARSFSNGLAAVCRDGMWGFIDISNRVAIEYQFYNVGYLGSDGIFAACVEIPATGEDAEGLELHETWKFVALRLGIKEE